MWLWTMAIYLTPVSFVLSFSGVSVRLFTRSESLSIVINQYYFHYIVFTQYIKFKALH